MKTFLCSAILLFSCGPELQEDLFRGDAPLSPEFFSLAFQDGFHLEVEGVDYKFSTLQCGVLDLPSGYLVIDQPLVFYDQKAIPITLPKGQFPVELSQALLSRDGQAFDKRNVMARIKFKDQAAEKWQAIAVFFAQGEVCGFMDYNLIRNVVQQDQIHDLSQKVQAAWRDSNVFLAPFESNQSKLTRYFVQRAQGSHFIGFQTGWGQTTVVSYVGRDSQGQIVEILSDFALFAYDQVDH